MSFFLSLQEQHKSRTWSTCTSPSERYSSTRNHKSTKICWAGITILPCTCVWVRTKILLDVETLFFFIVLLFYNCVHFFFILNKKVCSGWKGKHETWDPCSKLPSLQGNSLSIVAFLSINLNMVNSLNF